MTQEAAWTEDPNTLLRQQVLVRLVEHDLSSATTLAGEFGVEAWDVGHAFDILALQGSARTFERALGETFTGEAIRTASGTSLVSSWDALRTAGREKRACMAALLSWLDAHEGEVIGGTDDFAGDVRSYYYGIPFSSATIVEAARELRNEGLIIGTSTFQGPVIRPAITNVGKLVATHYDGDLMAWEAAKHSGGTNVSVSGSSGVAIAANSPGASQTVHVSSTSEQVLNLAAALEAMLPILQLEPALVASANGLVVQLQHAAGEGNSNPAKLKSLIGLVKDIATNAAGGAAGSALVALANQLLSIL